MEPILIPLYLRRQKAYCSGNLRMMGSFNWESRAPVVCPPIRFFTPKLGEAIEWNFVGSIPARSKFLKSPIAYLLFLIVTIRRNFRRRWSSGWEPMPLAMGPSSKAIFLANIIANSQGLTLTFLCLGFLYL